jgi:hypothetical protein
MSKETRKDDPRRHDRLEDQQAERKAVEGKHGEGTVPRELHRAPDRDREAEMVRGGNFIRVTNGAGYEIERAPLASTTAWCGGKNGVAVGKVFLTVTLVGLALLVAASAWVIML